MSTLTKEYTLEELMLMQSENTYSYADYLLWTFQERVELIKGKFPKYNYTNRKFKLISTIDVDIAFSYKHKGAVRTFGGFVNDFLHFRFGNIWDRLLTLFNMDSSSTKLFVVISIFFPN